MTSSDDLYRTVARIPPEPTASSLPVAEEIRTHTPPLARTQPPLAAPTGLETVAVSAQRTPEPGPLLGDHVPYIPGFVITGELARGGMGIVYSAIEVDLGREVAIKMLLPDLADAGRSVRRFLDEARITAQLPHPHIPPIHRLGTLPDGRPFLVMKLIRGRTLAAMLAARTERPLSQSAGELDITAVEYTGLMSVFEQVCHAVAYAHSRGIIHRDLKPSNIMVGPFGEVQVMDWGLAKIGTGEHAALPRGVLTCHSRASATLIGQAMGTPQFMPPEQARGEWDRVDARADVFALGGILAAILTGEPPYTGTDALTVLRRAREGDLQECRERLARCGADAPLIELACRCLSRFPDDRPAHAGEVARLLAAHRLGVETRLMVAEQEWAASVAKAEEAQRLAWEDRQAKEAAEERAQVAEFYADCIAQQAQEQIRRRRGVLLGLATVLFIAGYAAGHCIGREVWSMLRQLHQIIVS
ncbi:MAG: serine/threonine-protein kinase [Gemmataceae bacterium]|nr:serine/threonine protein kinase [Gemmata sp.]MDW8199291.1 serine/threonine-protein kinase [Gemmataceae bacterium]